MEEVDDFSRRFIAARDFFNKNGLCPDISEEAREALINFEDCILLAGVSSEEITDFGGNLLDVIFLKNFDDKDFDRFLDDQYLILINSNSKTHEKIISELMAGALYSESLKINEYIGIYNEHQLISGLSKCIGYVHGALEIININAVSYKYVSNESKIKLSSEIINKYKKEVLKSLATKGAASRHKEGRSCKEDVFKWADENMKSLGSMDEAADVLTDMKPKLVPYTRRTVRKWLTEWKKLRSAGTA